MQVFFSSFFNFLSKKPISSKTSVTPSKSRYQKDFLLSSAFFLCKVFCERSTVKKVNTAKTQKAVNKDNASAVSEKKDVIPAATKNESNTQVPFRLSLQHEIVTAITAQRNSTVIFKNVIIKFQTSNCRGGFFFHPFPWSSGALSTQVMIVLLFWTKVNTDFCIFWRILFFYPLLMIKS